MNAGVNDYFEIGSILPQNQPVRPTAPPPPPAPDANNTEAAELARAKLAAIWGESAPPAASASFDLKSLRNPAASDSQPASAPMAATTPTPAPAQVGAPSPAWAAPSPAPAETASLTIASTPSHPLEQAPAAATAPAQSSPASAPDIPLNIPVPQANPAWHHFKPVLGALASFALLFALFKAPVFITQLRFSFSKTQDTPPPTAGPAALAATHASPTLEIPKINVVAPVVFEPSLQEAAIQKSLQRGVVHYSSSVKPGQLGNSVIVGHSSNDWWEPGDYKFIFVLLNKLVPGDTFSLDYEGKKYIYQVDVTKVVEPTDLSVLAQTSHPSITLITCTPPGTAWKRLVVQARQISPDPSQVKPPESDLAEANSVLPSNAPSLGNQLSRLWNTIKGWFGADEPDSGPAEGDPGVPSTLPSGL